MTLADRIWARDPTVWVDDPATPEVADRLGWLDAPEAMEAQLEPLAALAEATRGAGRLILAGMGGSSLAPEVMRRVFGSQPGRPVLRLWDSTHPEAVPTLQDDDLILIASKSGGTIETACFEDWAWEATGGDADRFIAVTDPGTALARRAEERGYRAWHNPPDIGGRFSALSLFGLVPATIMGLDPAQLLAGARGAADACRGENGPWELLGRSVAARETLPLRDAEGVQGLGLWLEQLVAESTGKDGKGVLPVLGDPVADAVLSPAVDRSPYDLGGQFFGWSFATAVMGHVLGVNPFDQPDVASAKQKTVDALTRGHVDALARGAVDARTRRRGDVRTVLDGVGAGEYIAVLAYVPPTLDNERRLFALKARLEARTGVPVTVAFGPRYLHSTGQLHKGGPPTGRFLLVTPSWDRDVAIPGRDFTLGTLCRAQAAGDAEALRERGRPVAAVSSLEAIEEAV